MDDDSGSDERFERRPLHVTVLITMPVPPPLRPRSCWRESAKTLRPGDKDVDGDVDALDDDRSVQFDAERPVLYEIGVMKVQ